MAKKIAILITDGTEIIETLYSYDIFKWAGSDLEVDLINAKTRY